MSTAPRSEPRNWPGRVGRTVLGLFLLFGLLGARIVRFAWVEEASRLLIFILPVCFVTLYVTAGAEKTLWKEWGLVIAGTLTLTVILLWIFTGSLAQRLLKAKPKKSSA